MSGPPASGERDAAPATGSVGVSMQVTRGCLVVSIQTDLDDAILDGFRRALLERVRTAAVAAVILDVSAVVVMDAHDFESLRRSMEMAGVMGALPVIVGLRPGIVAALVDMDIQVDAVRTALDVEHAFELIAGEGS